jgi:hypothetical protein
MNTDVLSIGINRRVLTSEGILHPWNMPNLTKMTEEMLFPPITDGIVFDRSLCVVAMKEAGKSSLVNALATRAVKIYGEAVNVVASYEIKTAIECMDPKPVQLLIVDDAISSQNSRKAMSNAEDVADFFRIRHIYEERFRKDTGIVITVFITQRWMGIDVGFRQAHAIIFKSVLVDKRDNQGIAEFMGPAAYAELKTISERIYQYRDQEAKSRCIAVLPFSDKSGHYNFQYVKPWIRFRKSFDGVDGDPIPTETQRIGECDVFTWDRMRFIKQLVKRPNWQDEANAYSASLDPKYHSRADAARAIGITPVTMTRHCQRIQGELARAAGADYEKFVCRQLNNEGWKCDHKGGNGEPDIVAVDPSGKAAIISCKCMDLQREYTMDLDEIRPEMVYANAHKLPFTSVMLSVYNLHTREQKPLRRLTGKDIHYGGIKIPAAVGPIR